MTQKAAHTFKTLARQGTAEFKDRGSRFIAIAMPVNNLHEFKAQLSTIKEEHPKAAHHCFAYRIGLGDDALYRASDDGEPSGSAGRPILGQLAGEGITNAMIVVVRYFGGVLLGVPGLINAYKTAASLALQVTPEQEKAVERWFTISCSYPQLGEILHTLKSVGSTVKMVEQGLFCRLEAGVPLSRLDEVMQQLSQHHDITIASTEAA